MGAGRSHRRQVRGGRTDTSTSRPLLVLAAISDDWPPLLQEAVYRRNLVAATGRCPCGATLTMPKHMPLGVVTDLTVEHEAGCPAPDAPELYRAWKASR